MFDERRLYAQLALKGVTKKELANRLGISETTLYRKIKNDGSFSRKEIGEIAEILDIENVEGIFFAKTLA